MLDFGDVRALFTVGTAMWPKQRVRVYGTGGALTVNVPFNAFPDVPLTVSMENDVGAREIATGPADQYGEMFTAFAAAVRAGGPVPTPPSDALANMKVLDALFRSAESGRWEEV
jgi:predicted dehydrogenase